MKFPSSLCRRRHFITDARINPELSRPSAAGGNKALCKLTRFSRRAEGQVIHRRDGEEVQSESFIQSLVSSSPFFLLANEIKVIRILVTLKGSELFCFHISHVNSDEKCPPGKALFLASYQRWRRRMRRGWRPGARANSRTRPSGRTCLASRLDVGG